ncbi:hypothetical protein glysoja_040440 [Glycine soja]|uniref:Sieve element occlusion C-terminal domain-containing protein n=1 Tax=Glycine soja TaxID=3848 RepID=A0A0B2PVH6_GLYSO|nr:hypothetical protein glysoja_040440 [Glycine soja]
MVVVLSPQGKVQHSNAFHLIQAHGKRAFPFTFVKQEQINNEIYWVGSEIGNIYPIINTWDLLISEGSSVAVCGHGKTISETVEGFQNWKGSVTKKGFGLSFQGYHQKIVDITHRCSYLEISNNVSGKLPEI